jgi:hypothetical protein
MVVKYRNPL